MINKTKDYDLFIFRDDNRDKILESHIKRIYESIKSRNLLELKPIVVNEKMEIIDGQHRLLAAKRLNVEVYYKIEKSLDEKDILALNVSKNWSISDYLNFYCKHGHEEYIKFLEFSKKQGLKTKTSLGLALGKARMGHTEFREGKFIFHEESLNRDTDLCWDTINYIKKINGFSPYVTTTRFWSCLFKMIDHKDFDKQKWMTNMKKMVGNFSVKATSKDYLRMFQHIHNWNNSRKINLIDESFE